MKSTFLVAALGLLAAALRGQTAPVPVVKPGDLAAPGRVVSATELPAARAYDQQLYAPATTLVPPEKAQQVVTAFNAAYEKLGRPSLLIYVNRALVDQTSGLHLVARTEHTEGVQGPPVAPTAASPQAAPVAATKTTQVTAENTYTSTPVAAPSLPDRQMVREIERLFGRPLRAGGARLADQGAATELMADQPLDHFTTATNDAARKDRAALAQVADVVIEVLVSSRTFTVPGIAGDQVVTVPDIQATAIRLKDSVIIGQAGSADVLGKGGSAARLSHQFDTNDIAEATALALMADLAQNGGH